MLYPSVFCQSQCQQITNLLEKHGKKIALLIPRFSSHVLLGLQIWISFIGEGRQAIEYSGLGVEHTSPSIPQEGRWEGGVAAPWFRADGSSGTAGSLFIVLPVSIGIVPP